MASLHSPKNPYRAEIIFDKPIKNIGSVKSFTAESLESLEHLVESQREGMKATIYIWKNMKVYPEFDWQIVKKEHRG